MDLIKRLAIGATTGAILLGSVATPTFAAKAWNTNISNHSWAKAKAEDNDNFIVGVKNKNTWTQSFNVQTSNSGGNVQGGEDGNVMKTGSVFNKGVNDVGVNITNISF